MQLSIRIGQLVKESRRAQGLSQEDLARLASIERGRITRLECGKAAFNVDLLLSIANALKVNIYSLLPIEVKVIQSGQEA